MSNFDRHESTMGGGKGALLLSEDSTHLFGDLLRSVDEVVLVDEVRC